MVGVNIHFSDQAVNIPGLLYIDGRSTILTTIVITINGKANHNVTAGTHQKLYFYYSLCDWFFVYVYNSIDIMYYHFLISNYFCVSCCKLCSSHSVFHKNDLLNYYNLEEARSIVHIIIS